MFPINQILQGDCTRVLRTLPNEVVDLVVTDPPYGVRYQDGFGRSRTIWFSGFRVLCALRYAVAQAGGTCRSDHPWSRRAAPFEKHATLICSNVRNRSRRLRVEPPNAACVAIRGG